MLIYNNNNNNNMSEIDYGEGKIYLIKCHKDPSKVYVGSTAQTLRGRWAGHKNDMKQQPNTLLYKTMAENIEDWYIELYERFPCKNKDELKVREKELIPLLGTLNTHSTGIYKDYHERKAENYKKWIEKPENQEKRKAWRKEYNRNPEKIKMRYIKELNAGQIDYTRMKQTTIDKYDIKYDDKKKEYY